MSTPVAVMTYNIRLGGRNAAGVREVVRRVGPDVLLVNESPKTPLLWRCRCRRLAEDCGLRYVRGGREAGSNMIAVGSGVEVLASAAEVLPQPWFRPRRGIVSAQLRVAGHLLGVVSCHLSLDRGSRAREVDRVVEVARGMDGPVLVAGDLNEPPTGPSWRRLEQAGFVDPGSDAWRTFPSADPTRRIDAVLVSGPAPVAHLGDPGVPAEVLAVASDHRPVLARLALG